jgi:hypothetical protein
MKKKQAESTGVCLIFFATCIASNMHYVQVG